MRLLEFPCGRRALRQEAAATTAAQPRERAAAKDWEGKRRRRASPWRPSLVAISEDRALVVRDGAAEGRGGPRKATAKSPSRVIPSPFKNDYGHYGVPTTAVPAFAPTAFIF
ncbi:unnamed protein product [Musa acuminata subsp. malaccensis]|uniref:(wild Malaysian banana) hypothetical protein n=1 Tax=Musa acuminata subsp. malaccensis TaxID=214687 RepID=A0A804IVP7_MUSAM|nr:PREDICTED: uncharacterized protein LOC103982864 [Musa acuminata subsp. malaccensis]CAG1843847.1 unnamed protein product [Musa acuminata subsp. malaccensis]